MVAPFFVPKIGEDPPKKGLHFKICGFLVQKYVKTKKKSLSRKYRWAFSPNEEMRMGTTKQSEKSKVFTTNR